MDDRFFSAYFPGDHKICGVELKPFSFWHTLILSAIDSPFVNPSRQAQVGDLLLALRVCSTEYPDRPNLNPGFRDIFRMWRLSLSKRAVKKAATEFVEYIHAHTSRPEFWKNKESKGNSITAPALPYHVASLIRAGIPLKDAWNMSQGEALWMEAVLVVRDGGDIRFVYEGEFDDDPLMDLNDLPDEELFEIVKADLGEDEAIEFMRKRKQKGGE